MVLVDGPWSHREVTSGGLRVHLAEAGPPDGPLVVLLHGFAEFWWAWRHQLVALGEAGYHAVAPDLRGYGATDKPPRGYDGYTLSADVAGLVRALGAREAHLVGHDWGGHLAWTAATLHPRLVRSLTVLSAPHPSRLRQSLLSGSGQLTRTSWLGLAQLPRLPESRLLRNDASHVGTLLRRWGGPGFPDAETERRCRQALQVPGVAHCALEPLRWSVRSLTRPSGQRFLGLLDAGLTAPTLQLHGALDTCILPGTAHGSGAWAHGGYALQVLESVGHYPHEEAPAEVTAALLGHLAAT